MSQPCNNNNGHLYPPPDAYLAPALHRAYSPAAHRTLSPGSPPAPLPHPPEASSRTPVMEPYNPRQWGNRGQVSGSQMVFQQRHTMLANTTQNTGMEAAMPSPPPPYSPNTSENTGRATITSLVVDNAALIASPMADGSARNSPQVLMSPAFPPPPGQTAKHRDRSASGMAGHRAFFGFSGLRGKQPMLPESQQAWPSHAIRQPILTVSRPPASRRAASTGHVQLEGTVASSSAASYFGGVSPDSCWQPGMPLPGPPPGPPPSGARSQSLNRPIGVSSSSTANPEQNSDMPRQRAAVAPSLDPVPPTPADWVEGHTQDIEQVQMASQLPSYQRQRNDCPLRIVTDDSREPPLTRRPATRGTSAQGIRERRSRSRNANGASDGTPGPSNLVFPPTSGSISRRREHTRNVSSYTELSSDPSPGFGHTQSKRIPGNILTPPYTPAAGKPMATSANKHGKVPGSASSDRPISHILHTPNEESATMPAPIIPARPLECEPVKYSPRLDDFALHAIERHRAFVERELAAATDEDRLELFTNFIVHESRLRRDRYSAAYITMAGDIMDLTRDMWRSYDSRSNRRAATPSTSMSAMDPSGSFWASDGQPTSAPGNAPSSASSLGQFTPATDTASIGDPAEGIERSEGRQWTESFKPSLSPIPSMAVSTVPDEDSSRGRQPSRWWETSITGEGSIGKPDRMEKSRRETKYMGITPAALQASNDSPVDQSTSNIRERYMYRPDEYPQEKLGLNDGYGLDTPMATPHRVGERKGSTSDHVPLDVSRLVTLPPPYPRHHPAVNNGHPQLSDLRTFHRQLADQTEIQNIRDSYLNQDFASLPEQQENIKYKRSKLRADIQNKIANGSMSFAAAAKAESEFYVEEAERGKATARANFDMFETSVSHPLNALLTERLETANTSIEVLRSDLESGQDASDPNRALEEGDEHPERLEKLTLLKWLFEVREQLHKEMFDLQAMRCERYSEVILAPCQIQKDHAKIEEATGFFKKDSWERQITFAKECLRRFEELQLIMEKNVSRGVEDQLSAFWDIAPGLLQVVQAIPADMSNFEVLIPLQEYEENPTYHDHPLQYLQSLLNHAEKSAYQFIESQTNLLCLLHEVRTATTKSRLRLVEIERNSTSADQVQIHAEMEQTRRQADAHLTRDLKEKVGEVDAQWQEALGKGMSKCKERVRCWLEETGGLDDGLDD